MPTAIIPAVMGLIKMGVGAANKAQAKGEAQRLSDSRPKLGLNQDELKLSESELQQGLGARAERAYTQQADKGLSNSLSAIIRGGGNINSVGELYNSDDGRIRLTQLQENARLNQIQNLISSQRNNVNEQQKQFEFNQWAPWADKSQANAAALQWADAMIAGGEQTVGNAAMMYGQDQKEKSMFDKYLNAQNNNRAPQIQQQSGSQFSNMPTQNAWSNFNPVGNGQDFYQYSDTSQFNNFG